MKCISTDGQILNYSTKDEDLQNQLDQVCREELLRDLQQSIEDSNEDFKKPVLVCD